MPIDRGKLLTGEISFNAGTTPRFTVECRAVSRDLNLQAKPRNGRGTGRWEKTRAFRPGGFLILDGRVRNEGAYIPDDFSGQVASVVVTINGTAQEALSVRVDGHQIRLEDKEGQDWFRIRLMCRILQRPIQSGFNATQPVAVQPTPSNQELFAGLTKSLDPRNLQTTATVMYEIWPLGDTDAAENQALADLTAIVVTAERFPGAKVRSASLQPERDYDAGTILITLGLTDTEEDIVNAGTATTVDPNKLESSAQATGVFSPAAAPGGDFVETTTTTQEIHDGATRTSKQFALLDTKEAVEFPGTVSGNDPYDLEDNATITTVHNSATAPVDPTAPLGQLVERATTQVNRVRWRTTWRYANLNSEQAREFPAAPLLADPSSLVDEDHQSDVTDSSTLTATPVPRIAGLALRTTRSIRIGGTPEKWLHVWEFGRRTTEDDIEMPGTVTDDDPSNLSDEATITLVTATATPSIPGAPLGVHVGTETTQLHATRWKHVYKYANSTNAQKVTFPRSPIGDDPSDLTDTDEQTEINSSSTPPATPSTRIAGTKLRRTTSVRLSGTPEQWLHTFEFARRTEEDDVEQGQTTYDADESSLESKASVTVVEADATPDGGVSVSGMILRTITKKQLHDSKWAITYHFGETTTEQDVEFAGTITVDDPDNLVDEAKVTHVTDSGTYPVSLDTPPSGLKLRGIHSKQLTDSGKWQHAGEYGRRDTEDDIEMQGTVYVADQSGNVVAGTARVTVVEADGTSDGGVTVSGLVLRDIERKQIHDSKWEHTYIFGQTTHEQDIELPDTVYENDASNLTDTARVTLVNSSSTYPVALDTPPTTPTTGTLKLRKIKSVQLTSGGQWAHTGFYGLTTEEDDVEMGGSSVTDDDSDLADEQITVVVTGSGTPANPGTPTGLKLRETITRQLTDGKWRHEFRYARTNREDDVEFGETATILDAGALESGGAIAVVNTSATPPETPSAPAADTKLIATTTKQLHGAATPKYVHIFKYGVRTSQEDIEWLQAKAVVEAGHLDRQPITVEVTSSATPSAGTNPDATNLSLYRTISHRVTDTQYVHVFEWKPLTATEETVAKGSEKTIDSNVAASPPASLASDDRVVSITASATPVAADADAAGRICYRIETVRLAKVKWQHTYHYGFRSNEAKLESDRTQTTTDPNGLESSAVTADVWLVSGGAPADPSAPAAPTGLKLVDKTDLEIQNPLYRVRIYKWALTDSKDAIELPGSVLEFTPFTNISRRVTTVEASTDSLVTIGAAMLTTHQADVTVDKFLVQRINAAYVKKIVEYISQFSNVKARVYGGWQYFDSRFLTGTVQVYVSQVVERGDGLREVLITPQKQWFSHIDFTLSRRVSQSTLPTHFDKVGTRNNNPFLGIPAGLCAYLGGEPEMERSFAFPHVMAANYDFRFSTRGLYESEGLSMGWFTTDATVSVGWTNASTFGWGGFGLPGADYDEFLA